MTDIVSTHTDVSARYRERMGTHTYATHLLWEGSTGAGSCQLLSTGVMDGNDKPVRFTELTLAPTVRIAPGSDHDNVKRLAELAHEACYIANSLTARVRLDVTVVDA